MKMIPFARLCRLLAAGALVMEIGACGTLRAGAPSPPTFYSLETSRGTAPAVTPTPAPASASSSTAPTLIVNPPHAAAGFDSPHIMYVREAHKLEYFAHSEWVDTPARMLAPLLVATIGNTAAFRAVVLAPSSADGDLRLDTEIIRLQQEFASPPSRVRFTLRAYLVDDKTRRVLASREFEAAVPATSENAYGGVVAANRAVRSVVDELAAFCAVAARGWKHGQ